MNPTSTTADTWDALSVTGLTVPPVRAMPVGVTAETW